jgi:hypothetical protein
MLKDALERLEFFEKLRDFLLDLRFRNRKIDLRNP